VAVKDGEQLKESVSEAACENVLGKEETSAATDPSRAIPLLGAKSGGLYKYDRECGELTVISEYLRPAHVGRVRAAFLSGGLHQFPISCSRLLFRATMGYQMWSYLRQNSCTSS
jgi:hypothetical protein